VGSLVAGARCCESASRDCDPALLGGDPGDLLLAECAAEVVEGGAIADARGEQAGAHASIRPFGLIALTSLLIATYSIVTYAAHRWLAAGAVAAIATAAAARSHDPTLPLPSWLVPPLLLGGVWLAARLLRDRAERESRTAELAQRLQREQELERQLALREERERIARELHDIVSHGVSLMVLQSAAARTMTPAGSDGRGELLRGVEDSGRRALAELRQMLALLQGASDPPLAPQPGIDQLPELVRRVRDSGLPVELTAEGDARAITPAVGLTVYRIVQEALTNSLKHGARAGTHVALRYDCDQLHIAVLDAHAPPGTTAVSSEGRVLLGIRERIALHGGTVEIARDQRGAFAIRACLPLQKQADDDQAADRR
jgi:signal transduction histidine kinase